MRTSLSRIVFFIFMAVTVAGCQQQSNADIRLQKKTNDSVKQTGPQTVKEISPNAKIVTGAPLSSDVTEQDAAQTAKDKPGAVALKMEY